jgi:LEA14-like dessication related protein
MSSLYLPRMRVAAGLLLAATMAGCAGLPAGMEAPSVTIADIGTGVVGVFEQQFNIRLRIQNPNADDLRIDGISFSLELNGAPFATGVGNQAVTVPRYGTAFMPVEAVSSLGGLIGQFRALVQGDKPGFRYRLKGVVSIAGGSRVPFDRSGEFDLGSLAPK